MSLRAKFALYLGCGTALILLTQAIAAYTPDRHAPHVVGYLLSDGSTVLINQSGVKP